MTTAKLEALRHQMWKAAETVHQATPRKPHVLREEHAWTPSIWRCVCGAPTFQQPCPFCGYYPDAGAYKAEAERYDAAHRNVTSREVFVASVNRVGGFHVFYARKFKQTCAWTEEKHGMRPAIERAIAEAAAEPPAMTAEELWEEVKAA